jgi:hypothetical protein
VKVERRTFLWNTNKKELNGRNVRRRKKMKMKKKKRKKKERKERRGKGGNYIYSTLQVYIVDSRHATRSWAGGIRSDVKAH